MDTVKYFKSLSDELSSLKNRVCNIIDNPHWVTDGEWKKSVLKTAAKVVFRETLKFGTGIYTKKIWILIYFNK